jgi:methyl-accepting chemotaxis protein
MNPALVSAAAVVLAAAFTGVYAMRSGSRATTSIAVYLLMGPMIAGLGAIVAAAAGYTVEAAIGLAVVLLVWGVLSVHALEAAMRAPALALAETLKAAANLDLRGNGVPASPEAKAAAEALATLVAALRDAVAKLRRASEAASDNARSIRDSAGNLAAEGPKRGERLTLAAGNADGLHEAVEGATRDLGSLAAAASRCSSSSLEVEASIEEVGQGTEKLSTLIDVVTGWVADAGTSVRSIARNVESLATASDETASAMTEMDASIRAVDRNADETAKLSLQVQRDAETGAESVQQTIQGIGRIRDYSLEVAGVVGSLGRRAEAIGDVVTVINEVAEQTNLLALNAAIIAAQAGEHGKSFAVVADEIKELAERTASSTKEIQELVRNVQEETANAVQVIERGKKSVVEGVELSGRAGAALAKILESARRSTHMAHEIARATAEQGKGTMMAAASVARIAQMIEGINVETSTQAKSGDKVGRTAEELRGLAAEVRSMVKAQGKNGREVARAAGEIMAEARRIDVGLRLRASDANAIARSLGELSGDGGGVDGKVRALEGAARDLEGHLQVVRGELDRFAM